jgi:alkylhydroperoxidase family enzyme
MSSSTETNQTPENLPLLNLMGKDAVSMENLMRNYSGPLGLVKALLGVIPNCDPYFEIWPPCFRTYNMMVPNFLNLPVLLFGFGAPKDVVGLAMYVSSRTSGCMYCSAHCCDFAIRRGSTKDKLESAFNARGNVTNISHYSEGEKTVIAAAKAVASIPAKLTKDHIHAMKEHYPTDQVEWILLSTVMMGYLNKMLDSLGAPLEEDCILEVQPIIQSTGWQGSKHVTKDYSKAPPSAIRQDSIWTYLSVIPHVPNALSLEGQWSKDIPEGGWKEIGPYLERLTGYDFPILGKIHQPRVVTAIAVMLKENLCLSQSITGIAIKVKVAQVFLSIVSSSPTSPMFMHGMVNTMASEHHITKGMLEEIASYARDEGQIREAFDKTKLFSEKERAILALAISCSYSPSVISLELYAQCGKHLTSAEMIEILTWISMLQMLYRLEAVYTVF